jgi:hypothetical protein
MTDRIVVLVGSVSLLSVLAASSLAAQQSGDARPQRVDKAQAATRTLSGAGAVAGTQVVQPSLLAAIVNKEKLARASFGITRGSGAVEWNPWFALSGALDESDATVPVVLADLSGMRATTKVAVGLNAQRWKWGLNVDAMKALCRSYFRDPLLVRPELRAPIQAAMQAKTSEEAERRLAEVADSLATKQCNSGSFVGERERATLQKQVDFGRIYLFGFGAEWGRQTYKFADTTSATFSSQTESPGALVIGGGIYFPTTGVLTTASLRAERSFAGGTPRQFCVRTGAEPSLQCRTVALAGPGKSDDLLATTEMRWFANSTVGISPRLTLDLRGERRVGVELPILLRQATDQGFSSALALGWRSKRSEPSIDDRAYISLMVGVNFGIGLSLLK